MPTQPNQPTHLTPAEFIASHWLTAGLAERGWTTEERDRLRFQYADPHMDFSDWALRGLPDRPLAVDEEDLGRAYAGLKWSVIEDAAEGRAIQQLWGHIRSIALDSPAMLKEPSLAEAPKTPNTPKMKCAVRRRGRIDKDGATIRDVIAHVARNPDHRNLVNLDLWPHFKSELADRLLAPELQREGDGRKEAIEYDSFSATGRSTITLGGFLNAVAKTGRDRPSRKKDHPKPGG